MDNTSLPSLLSDYKDYIKNTRRLAPRTIKEYMLDLSLFFRFILVYKYTSENNIEKGTFREKIDNMDLSNLTNNIILEVTWDDVQKFLAYYSGVLKNNERTQKRKIVCIRRFYDYLLISKKIAGNPIGQIDIRTPKKQPLSLTEEQVRDLLQPAIENYEGPFKERDKAIMVLFLELGLRLSELVDINLEDIENDVILIKGKGKKERKLPLNNLCNKVIEEYLSVRPNAHEIKAGHQKALFISRVGRRISTRTVQLIVDKFLNIANLNDGEKRYTPHKLRHTFATLLANQGVSVHDIQEFLGHENLATTSVYINSRFKRLKEVKESVPILKLDANNKNE